MHAQCNVANIVSKRHIRGAVKLSPSSLVYMTDIECDSGDCPSNMADSGSHDLALLRRVVVEVVEKVGLIWVFSGNKTRKSKPKRLLKWYVQDSLLVRSVL